MIQQIKTMGNMINDALSSGVYFTFKAETSC